MRDLNKIRTKRQRQVYSGKQEGGIKMKCSDVKKNRIVK